LLAVAVAVAVQLLAGMLAVAVAALVDLEPLQVYLLLLVQHTQLLLVREVLALVTHPTMEHLAVILYLAQ
jgi:hypothetical protein